MDVFARLLHNPHIGVQMPTVEMQPFTKQLYWEKNNVTNFIESAYLQISPKRNA